MRNESFKNLDDALDDQDFALIIDNQGQLKGLWMPDDEVAIPENIVTILKGVYGIDLYNDDIKRKIH